MKNVIDVEAYTNALRNRALQILREFRVHAAEPEKIIELADELSALITEFEAHAVALDQIQEMTELLISNKCSGPH
jgi:hypothetical protein